VSTMYRKKLPRSVMVEAQAQRGRSAGARAKLELMSSRSAARVDRSRIALASARFHRRLQDEQVHRVRRVMPQQMDRSDARMAERVVLVPPEEINRWTSICWIGIASPGFSGANSGWLGIEAARWPTIATLPHMQLPSRTDSAVTPIRPQRDLTGTCLPARRTVACGVANCGAATG